MMNKGLGRSGHREKPAPPPQGCRAGLHLLMVVALVIGLDPPTARAWSYHTHRKIVSDAFARMPQPFVTRFQPYRNQILRGSTDPDSLLRDFENHVHHVHGGHRKAGTPTFIKKSFDELVARFRRGDPDETVAYHLGLLAHYIADLNQPLHTDGANVDPQESNYHMTFEHDVQGRLSRIPVQVPINLLPVTEPAKRVREMALAANAHYLTIGAAYKGGRRILDLEAVVAQQYSAAVRHTMEFWLGIMQQAGVATSNPAQMAVGTASTPAGASPAHGSSTVPSSARGPDILLSEDTYNRPEKATSNLGDKIDLNQATLAELMAVRGIGRVKAQAIIDHRAHSPFQSVHDLIRVQSGGRPAFSARFIEANEDLFTTK